jgi:hypothetical protein
MAPPQVGLVLWRVWESTFDKTAYTTIVQSTTSLEGAIEGYG